MVSKLKIDTTNITESVCGLFASKVLLDVVLLLLVTQHFGTDEHFSGFIIKVKRCHYPAIATVQQKSKVSLRVFKA